MSLALEGAFGQAWGAGLSPGARNPQTPCLSELCQGHLEGHPSPAKVPLCLGEGGGRRGWAEGGEGCQSAEPWLCCSAPAERGCWSADAPSSPAAARSLCRAADPQRSIPEAPSLPRAAAELLPLPPKALPKGKISAQETYSSLCLSLPAEK